MEVNGQNQGLCQSPNTTPNMTRNMTRWQRSLIVYILMQLTTGSVLAVIARLALAFYRLVPLK